MIEFAQITGEIRDNLYQVKMRTGESLYAPIAVVSIDAVMPSKEWISANKDKFLALVSFEKDLLMNPIIIGFYPVKGSDSSQFNILERLLTANLKLIEQLLKGKVNTMLGPQPFMPDTIQIFNELQKELTKIQKLITPLKLE